MAGRRSTSLRAREKHLTVPESWKRGFLEALVTCYGNVTRAAQKVGISRATAYVARGNDLEFAKAWDSAQEQVTDMAEEEALVRGIEGREETVGVTKSGDPVVITRRSDRLLELVLRGRRRPVYGDRAGVQLQITADQIQRMDDADLDRLIAKLAG